MEVPLNDMYFTVGLETLACVDKMYCPGAATVIPLPKLLNDAAEIVWSLFFRTAATAMLPGVLAGKKSAISIAALPAAFTTTHPIANASVIASAMMLEYPWPPHELLITSAPFSTAYSIAIAKSLMSPDPLKLKPFTAIILALDATPIIPFRLLPTPPIVPATWVP